jgi:hypothetical protein
MLAEEHPPPHACTALNSLSRHIIALYAPHEEHPSCSSDVPCLSSIIQAKSPLMSWLARDAFCGDLGSCDSSYESASATEEEEEIREEDKEEGEEDDKGKEEEGEEDKGEVCDKGS